MEEIEFSKLNKLSADAEDPTDLLVTGAPEAYDRTFDKITTKSQRYSQYYASTHFVRPLQYTGRTFYHPSTVDDVNIRKVYYYIVIIFSLFSSRAMATFSLQTPFLRR